MKRAVPFLLLFFYLLIPLSCGEEDDGKPAGWLCTQDTECTSGHCVNDVEGRGVCI